VWTGCLRLAVASLRQRYPQRYPRQRRDCDLNPGPSAPESSTLSTRLPSHPLCACVYLWTPCRRRWLSLAWINTLHGSSDDGRDPEGTSTLISSIHSPRSCSYCRSDIAKTHHSRRRDGRGSIFLHPTQPTHHTPTWNADTSTVKPTFLHVRRWNKHPVSGCDWLIVKLQWKLPPSVHQIRAQLSSVKQL